MALRNRDTAFLGHPIGLATLFFTEMWERFSYYGGRAILIIYLTTAVEKGGRGLTDTKGGLVMAVYLSSVYLLSLPGGWIADRFLGQRLAVTFGGLGIAAGNALLALPFESAFYPGLAVIALGTGLLKPNVSTIVGQLYSAKDLRRDSGFTIYYMGINIGAGIAPAVCGFFAQNDSFREFLEARGIDPNWCWHVGFGSAAVGMVAGLVVYLATQRWLGDAGKHPTIPEDPARQARDRGLLAIILVGLAAFGSLFAVMDTALLVDIFGAGLAIGSVVLFIGLYRGARDAGERTRVIAMIPLFVGAIAFFAVFEQASTTLSLFAEKLTRRELLGFHIEASYYQTINSIFVVVLAGFFGWLWLRLAKAKREPSSVTKFGIGMVLAALSFVVMLPSLPTVMGGGRTSGGYLIALYFFSTCSELCISPVGLSSMSKLAPTRLAGMVMGTWFLATAVGNYLAGRAAGFSASWGYDRLFYFLIVASLIVAGALFAVAPKIRRMMAADEAAADAAAASAAS